MITKRSARTIRKAISDARKFSRMALLGYAGMESRNLKGLYGRAYIRSIFPYSLGSDAGAWKTGWLGFAGGRGIP